MKFSEVGSMGIDQLLKELTELEVEVKKLKYTMHFEGYDAEVLYSFN